MKKIDVGAFYCLGSCMGDMKRLHVGSSASDVMRALYKPEDWLRAFMIETEGNGVPLKKTRATAKKLLEIIKRATTARTEPLATTSAHEKPLDIEECGLLGGFLAKFESEFSHECRELEAFVLTQKALFNTRRLIEAAETQFPEHLLAVMPEQTRSDIKQAGRCLCF
jgi:hypothetical protein